MIRNYFTIALRNLIRHKFLSFINIFGLAMGMSVSVIILILIQDQFSYDTFHPYPDRTFRITSQVVFKEGGVDHYASSPLPLAKALTENYSFIENSVRVYPAIQASVSYKNKDIFINNGAFVDASFFEVFGFSLAKGNPDDALAQPNSVVLSYATASKFFGSENPLGKIVAIEGLGNFTITGVLKNLKQKSHIEYEIFASMVSVPVLEQTKKLKTTLNQWNNYSSGYTYILVKPEVDETYLTNSLSGVSKRTLKTFSFKGNEREYTFKAQSLKDITPGNLTLETGAGMSIESLVSLSIIAFTILLIASFNYTNLIVARSINRAKEVGIRKIVGAVRHQIFAQFLVESILLSFIALLFAFILSYLIPLNLSLSQEMSGIRFSGAFLLWVFLFSVFVGLLTGVLPAWLLSKIGPIQALKNVSKVKLLKGLNLRKTLIVIQFSLSLIFIINLLVFYEQSNYMVTADYGFNRKNIITIDLQGNDYKLLSNEIGRHANVASISLSSGKLGFNSSYGTIQKQKTQSPIDLNYYIVDQNFVQDFELELIAGHSFPKDLSATTERAVILNEKALQILNLGLPGEAIGKVVWMNDSIQAQVIGVLKDFKFQSFKHAITPLALRYKPAEFRYLIVKVHDHSIQGVLSHIQNVWRQFDIFHPLEYTVYEQEFYKHHSHKADITLIGTFALMAVFISCLGLLGMVMYTMENRIKEVGIRKVLGASTITIVILLSKDFLKLLAIAGLIASPIGYLLGNQFLNTFTYKINFSVGLLLLSLLTMLFLGIITICSQTIKAATVNPINSIRNE